MKVRDLIDWPPVCSRFGSFVQFPEHGILSDVMDDGGLSIIFDVSYLGEKYNCLAFPKIEYIESTRALREVLTRNLGCEISTVVELNMDLLVIPDPEDRIEVDSISG